MRVFLFACSTTKELHKGNLPFHWYVTTRVFKALLRGYHAGVTYIRTHAMSTQKGPGTLFASLIASFLSFHHSLKPLDVSTDRF